MVLTPRRWRQRGDNASALRPADGGKKARFTRESTKQPLKPLRRKRRFGPALPVVTLLVCFLSLHARLRAWLSPGVSCALFFMRVLFRINRTRSCRGNAEVWLFDIRVVSSPVIARSASDEAIQSSRKMLDRFAYTRDDCLRVQRCPALTCARPTSRRSAAQCPQHRLRYRASCEHARRQLHDRERSRATGRPERRSRNRQRSEAGRRRARG